MSSTGALSTCSGGAQSVIPRALPAAPAWAQATTPARPPDGTPELEVAKIWEGASRANAGRLWCLRAWYDERRAEYAGNAPLKSYPKTCPAAGTSP